MWGVSNELLPKDEEWCRQFFSVLFADEDWEDESVMGDRPEIIE